MRSYRIYPVLFFIFITSSCIIKSHSKHKFLNETDSISYALINVFVKDVNIQKTPIVPTRSFYSFANCGNCDSTLDEIDKFLFRIKDNLNNDPALTNEDLQIIRKQILNPTLTHWDKDYINIKITRKAKFWNNSYPISVPIFSKDKKKAIIFANYWGMSRVFLYKYNQKKKIWEYYIQIWQDGS